MEVLLLTLLTSSEKCFTMMQAGNTLDALQECEYLKKEGLYLGSSSILTYDFLTGKKNNALEAECFLIHISSHFLMIRMFTICF